MLLIIIIFIFHEAFVPVNGKNYSPKLINLILYGVEELLRVISRGFDANFGV